MSGMALAVAFTLLPLIVWQVLRTKALSKQRRKHERFVMNSEIKVKVGNRELVGQMNTISVGGLSFKTDEMLDKGGIVTMMIESPDGQEKIQVQGHIVWNEENRAYGVQFDQAKDSIASHIQSWTRNLVKAN
jgi:Tfp pilus assembly protein PilZ